MTVSEGELLWTPSESDRARSRMTVSRLRG